MKFVMLLSSLLFIFPVQAKSCHEIKGFEIFGETISYEPQGSEIVKVRKWYPLPPYISEHLGSFQNLKIKLGSSGQGITNIFLNSSRVNIEKSDDNTFVTKGFNLHRFLIKNGINENLKVELSLDKSIFCKFWIRVKQGG